MKTTSWLWIALVLFGSIGTGTIVYTQTQPSVPEAAPALVATPVVATTTVPVETRVIPAKKTSPKASTAVTATVPTAVPTPPLPAVLAPATYDNATQDMIDAINASIRANEKAQQREQDELEDWASAIKNQNNAYQDCDAKINAAEDKIRAEIQAAGGFGTESQVRAMALSRVSC